MHDENDKHEEVITQEEVGSLEEVLGSEMEIEDSTLECEDSTLECEDAPLEVADSEMEVQNSTMEATVSGMKKVEESLSILCTASSPDGVVFVGGFHETQGRKSGFVAIRKPDETIQQTTRLYIPGCDVVRTLAVTETADGLRLFVGGIGASGTEGHLTMISGIEGADLFGSPIEFHRAKLDPRSKFVIQVTPYGTNKVVTVGYAHTEDATPFSIIDVIGIEPTEQMTLLKSLRGVALRNKETGSVFDGTLTCVATHGSMIYVGGTMLNPDGTTSDGVIFKIDDEFQVVASIVFQSRTGDTVVVNSLVIDYENERVRIANMLWKGDQHGVSFKELDLDLNEVDVDVVGAVTGDESGDLDGSDEAVGEDRADDNDVVQ